MLTIYIDHEILFASRKTNMYYFNAKNEVLLFINNLNVSHNFLADLNTAMSVLFSSQWMSTDGMAPAPRHQARGKARGPGMVILSRPSSQGGGTVR